MPSVRQMPVKPKYLRAQFSGRAVGVDRQTNTLKGFVVAQLGPFKTPGRGEFDLQALKDIVKLGNGSSRGLKSRFTHPDMSNDGLGKHLGRVTNFSLGKAKDDRTGEDVPAVRADLKFDKTALETPPGGGKPYGQYVMDLAESDGDALSSSLVITDLERFLMNDKGNLEALSPDEEGGIWRPLALQASDIVDTGDAVDSLLSVDSLPLSELWKGAEMLDSVFAGQTFEVVCSRGLDFFERYLQRRFDRGLVISENLVIGYKPKSEPKETPKLDAFRKRLWRMEEKLHGVAS